MHECPECFQGCYCHGDIDDCLLGTLAACSHCDNDEVIDDDNDDGARTCDHPSTHEESGGFLVCSDCGETLRY